MKKFLYLVFVISILHSPFSILRLYGETKTINVVKEGMTIPTVSLFLINGMGYLYSDDVANIYGARIKQFPLSKKVVLTFSNKDITFLIGSKEVAIGKVKLLMNKVAKWENSKLLIPLEFVLTKSFTDVSGFYTEWDYNRLILRVSTIPNVFPMRYYSYKDKTRLVIQTVEKKEIQLDQSKEKKIMVKIYKSKVNTEKSSISINDGVVNGVDATNLERDVLFIANLGAYSGKATYFTLSSPFRFVVDIERVGSVSSKSHGLINEISPSADKFQEVNIPLDIIPFQATPPDISSFDLPFLEKKKSNVATGTIHKIKKIVIDAGHGGNDPGAIGSKKTEEKKLNLIISQLLSTLLEKNGYEVFLTRSNDTFIPLSDRMTFANKVMADLFVSIHCNASVDSNTRGFEIYFLSEKATDRVAETVANMENSVLAFEKSSLASKKDIKKILLSMVVNEFMNESASLCGVISKKVCESFSNFDNRGVKQANFYVLRGATMPSVLIEVGFLSNAKEEKVLNQKKFQRKMVENIFNGIKEYEKRLK